ncbi:ABC transporter substrate-binding protein [Pseudomaricurvus alcaniphilus]|uniref:MlaC/ttg2D family ABC transporter substrate-binding protein n=1 Tax=Pseudomaricurvus alcaniphilus TaxID=1166482 RepID=UPI00140B5B25|nr:ABC transporter substrate-binding protein [Pseudomaricurvus alcaniphilus]NHN39663.1 ABC transporter substrate-binding protein [Pseudomaricurvus alcaniphilus]
MGKIGMNWLRLALLAWVGMAVVAAAQAEATEETPHQLVQRVTAEVLSVVESRGELLERDPAAFYLEIGAILEPVVAFDYIANGVMGSFARQASAAQRKRFSEVFQTNMISTYAKGMVVYANQKVEILPPVEEPGDQRKASVVQKILGDGSNHTVVYSMGKSKLNNQWKLLNVIIDGVNLGNTFRSQFAQAMKKHGDLDLVIDNWSS